jgi:hypothetical protein
MCLYENSDPGTQSGEYQEALARQEELYLESAEEEFRLIWETDSQFQASDGSPLQASERLARELIADEFQASRRGGC